MKTRVILLGVVGVLASLSTPAEALQRALIHGQRVAQVVEPGQEFPVAAPLTWVDAPDNVRADWRYTNGEFIAPPVPPVAEDADALRQSLGAIFAGTAAQRRARWVDILEAYPPAANFLTLLRGKMTPDAKATILELATRVKARIGQGNQVLTQTEYDNLKALATQHQLGALFP